MSEKQLMRYYKQKLYNERSIIARSFDFIALRLVFFGILYLLLRSQMKTSLSTAFVAIIAVGMISVALHMISSFRLESFIAAYKEKLRQSVIKEQLSLMDHSDFIKLCKTILLEKNCKILFMREEYGIGLQNKRLVYIKMVQVHCSKPLSATDLVSFYHKAKEKRIQRIIVLFSTSLSAEAKAMLDNMDDIEVECVTEEDLVAHAKEAGLSPTDEDIISQIKKELDLKKKAKASLHSIIFMPQKTKRYAISGALLMIMSFFTVYNLYFRIFAIMLLGLSAISLFYSISKAKA